MENPDGSTYLDYENAVVYDTSFKEEIHRQFAYEQESPEDDFVWDPETQTYRHRYADIDPELLDQYGEEYLDNPDAYEDDEEIEGHEFTGDEIEYLYNQVGGVDNYQSLMQFAADNLDAEFIESFDAVMETGDVEAATKAIEILVNIYNGAIDDEYTEEDDEYYTDEEEQDLADSVYELVGGENQYDMLLRFAVNTLPQEYIEAYDSAMLSNDYNLMENMVMDLQSKFQEAYRQQY